MTITLRRALKEDMPAVFKMVDEMAHGLGEERYLVNTEKQLIEDWGKYHCLLAVDENNTPVGHVLYSYIYLSWQGNSIYVDDVFVGDKYRRQNIATLLMDELFETARLEKITCVRWYVMKSNEAAINFYKKYDITFEENRFRCNYFVKVS